jgi:hypothetical protein
VQHINEGEPPPLLAGRLWGRLHARGLSGDVPLITEDDLQLAPREHWFPASPFTSQASPITMRPYFTACARLVTLLRAASFASSLMQDKKVGMQVDLYYALLHVKSMLLMLLLVHTSKHICPALNFRSPVSFPISIAETPDLQSGLRGCLLNRSPAQMPSLPQNILNPPPEATRTNSKARACYCSSISTATASSHMACSDHDLARSA